MPWKDKEKERVSKRKWWAELSQEKRKKRYERTAAWAKTEEGRAYHRNADRIRNRTRGICGHWWAKNIKKRFGMTPAEYEVLMTIQDNVCAICRQYNQGGKRLAVDHDHTTGRIRGLLCDKCNHALGELRDNSDLVFRAWLYLQPWPAAEIQVRMNALIP